MEEKKKNKFLIFVIIVIILAGLAVGGKYFVSKILRNYINTEITDKVNLVINYSNVTGRMKKDLIVDDNGVIYLSFNDIQNYYDDNIYYDEQYNQIVTSSENKLAVLKLNEKFMYINENKVSIKGAAKKENGVYYLPISEMQDVYDISVKKIDNKVVLESLDKQLVSAEVSKKTKVKFKTTNMSKTLEKLKVGDIVYIAEVKDYQLPTGWIKVRTQNGTIGYIEEKNISNKQTVREDAVYIPQIDGKISLVWDYFSEYNKAPDNTGKKYDGVNVVSPSFFYLGIKDMQKQGAVQRTKEEQCKVLANVGDAGVQYINWAKANGYKIWPKFSNETLSNTIDEFSEIINDYELRRSMINELVEYVQEYDLDGINLDFEFMYEKDKDAFSKFVIELAPRLRAIDACLSVDVTAPDGSANWSMCYDRNLIGEVADYIVFMAYDQYGTNTIGTTSGYNWVLNSLKKFLETEEIPSEKVILGLPFYTKLWKTKDDKVVDSSVVTLNNINSISLPNNAEKEFKKELQQYFVQYEKNGYIYKIWIEDEDSLAKKLDLVNEFNIAGAAYWRKGFESQTIWNVIKEKLNLKN